MRTLIFKSVVANTGKRDDVSSRHLTEEDLRAAAGRASLLEQMADDDFELRRRVRDAFGVDYVGESGKPIPVVRFAGFQVAIENPAGSVRSGQDRTGVKWSVEMPYDYGYFVDTLGADGDAVDVFLGSDEDSDMAYVVRSQTAGQWGKYDEDKVMLGFSNEDAARVAFLAAYSDPRFLGSIVPMSLDRLRVRLQTPGKLRKCIVFARVLSKDKTKKRQSAF